MSEPKELKAYRVVVEHAWKNGEYIVVAGDFGEAADKALAFDLAGYVQSTDQPPSTRVKTVHLYGPADSIIAA